MKTILEVIGKPLTYATRRLLPGDTFEAPVRDARALLAVRRVRVSRILADIPAPSASLITKVLSSRPAEPTRAQGDTPPHQPPTEPSEPTAGPPAATDDIKELRHRYFEKVGKRPFMGWDAETLLEKMNAGE